MIGRTDAAMDYAWALQEAESAMLQHLGPGLWIAIHPTTQMYLKRAEHHYRCERTLSFAENNFADSLLNLSNAILYEFVLRFWHRVCQHERSRSQSRLALQRHGDPEWGEMVRLISQCSIGKWPAIVQVGLMSNVRLNLLAESLPDLEELRAKGRNIAAHCGLIDHERAAPIYSNMTERGVLRKILAALHGTK